MSVVAHGILIGLAVWTTLDPRRAARDHDDEALRFVELAVYVPPASAQPVPAAARRAAPTPKGFQVLQAPVELPAELPRINLVAPVTRPEDYSGRGVLGGLSAGIAPATIADGGLHLGDPIDLEAADQPPYMLPGQMGPSYPDSLRFSALDGIVIVRFVIDTLGRAELATVRIVHASHPLFAAAVERALDRLRFSPAHFSGKRVRVRTEQSFEFHLASR